jgi:hypothetical protein
MEGAMKKAKTTWTDALENKDVLFMLFSFLEPREVGLCAQVSRAFRRAAGQERLWEAKCTERGYRKLADETWKGSFELTHPKCRDLLLEQAKRQFERLAAVPLGVLKKVRRPPVLTPIGWPGYGLTPLSQAVQTVAMSFTAARDMPEWFATLFDVRITLATGQQPGSKDTRRVTTRFVLNGTHSLVFEAGLHDQLSCPKILYCEQLEGGTASDQKDVLGWMGVRAPGNVYALVYNTFDGPTTVVKDNVLALLKAVNAPASVKPMQFLDALAGIGMKYAFEMEDEDLFDHESE